MAGRVVDTVADIAKNISIAMEMRIAIVIKPRPRFIPQTLWLRLASLFIYIERTQPTMMVKDGVDE